VLYRVLKLLLRLEILAGLYELRIAHSERIPKRGGAILAANHYGLTDPPFIALATSRQVHFMARATRPAVMLFYRLMGAFPVHKGKPDLGAIRMAIRLLDAGKLVGMMVISHTDKDQKNPLPQPGVCAIVRRCKEGIPILPIGVYWHQPPFETAVIAIVIGGPLMMRINHPDRQGMREELGLRIATARLEAELLAKEPRPR